MRVIIHFILRLKHRLDSINRVLVSLVYVYHTPIEAKNVVRDKKIIFLILSIDFVIY